MNEGEAEQVDNKKSDSSSSQCVRNALKLDTGQRHAGPFSLKHVSSLADHACFRKIVYHLFGLDKLDQLYATLPRTNSPQPFIRAILKQQHVSSTMTRHSEQNLTNGPLIVVANHPFGLIEGLLLLDFLLDHRDDVKLMANKFLQGIPELADMMLGVLPYSDKTAITNNMMILRETLNWLSESHCLVCFPAGNVSRFQFSTCTIKDDTWSEQVVRLARSTQANFLPVYFHGRNSLLFYLSGLFGAKFHSLLYVREFFNKQGVSIKMQIGEVIPVTALDSLEISAATQLIREKVYRLGSDLE